MRSHMMMALGLVCLMPTVAISQTAQVRMLHDSVSGVVLPGQTIRLRTVVSWQNASQFAGFKGDALATPGIGTASNVGSAYMAGILYVYGQAIGSDVIGHDIAQIPAFFMGTVFGPSTMNTGFDYLTYNWTAPVVASPTVVEFDFVTPWFAPGVRLYPSTSSTAWVNAPTTFIGTSILVLPGPGSGAVLAAAGVLAWRRRR